jgi:7-cyano-7-deazaguanine synthase
MDLLRIREKAAALFSKIVGGRRQVGGAGEVKAVCLLSGGMDSAVAAAIAKAAGYGLYALSFQYNQRHSRELEAAKELVISLGVLEHKIFHIDLRQIGGSALTDEIAVPAGRKKIGGDIPATYVPARNTIFLSIALAYAEVVDADAVFIGANSVDYSGYPDCRPEYFKKFQELADVATKKTAEGRRIKVEAPLLQMTKADIVRKGLGLSVPFESTWSCYQGRKKACGVCDSCILRLNGFAEAGVKDPLEYEK